MHIRPVIALLLACASPALAAPQDYAAAVAPEGRPADAVALDASRKPAEVLDFLELKPGATVLDVMAGSGYYSEIAGRAVGPNGKVIAFEPVNFYDDKSKANWEQLTKRQPNVRVMPAAVESLTLEPNSLDLVLMHMVYHDLYWESEQYKFPRLDPDKVLKNLYAAVKPGGVVGVVDHVGAAGDTRAIVDKLHRIDPAVARADFERAGFVLEAESDMFRTPSDDHSKLVFDPSVRGKTDRFVMRFRKPR